MRKAIVLLLSLALLAPAAALAGGKGHPALGAGSECADCHAAEQGVWFEGKHGLMNVGCTVCHGSPGENFVPVPEAGRCIACHAGMVGDMESRIAKRARSCWLCHSPHSLDLSFHGERR